MKNEEIVNLAQKWYELNGLNVYENKGCFYISVNDYELELSWNEIQYRAELMLESKQESLKNQ